MKYTLEKIYPGSVFRLWFFIVLAIGGCMGFIFLIVSIFLHQVWLGLAALAAGVPFLAFIAGSIGFIVTSIYSAFAKKFGGINVELKPDEK